jgi:hypothetical protein
MGSGLWNPAGEIDIFRNHYATCHAVWEREALHAETEQLGRRLERASKTRKGAWVGVLLAVVGVLGAGAFLWWRLSLAESVGFASLARATEAPSLPAPVPRPPERVAFPERTAKKFNVLYEPELLDTAGVKVGEGGAPIANRMEFDESGEVQSIPAETLARITEDARRGLVDCARQLAQSNEGFSGTEVSFTVAPKRLADFVVGREVAASPTFRACVKTALGRVSVPDFGGNPRRVTVPLRVAR